MFHRRLLSSLLVTGSALLFPAAWAAADRLVLVDGRQIKGHVEAAADGGYVVTRGTMKITVAARDVAEWVKDGSTAPAPAKPAAKPAPSKPAAVATPTPTTPAKPPVQPEAEAQPADGQTLEAHAERPSDVAAAEPVTDADAGSDSAGWELFAEQMEEDVPASAVGGTASATPAAPEADRLVYPTKHGTHMAAAFPVAPDLLVTAASVVDGADEVQLQNRDGDPLAFTVVRSDARAGLALLKLTESRVQPLPVAEQFAGGAVRAAGFLSASMFSPTADLVDATCAATPATAARWTIASKRNPRVPGGPVLAGGAVVGVCLAAGDTDPAKVPVVSLAQLRKFLGTELPATAADATGPADPAAVVLQLVANHGAAPASR